MYCIYCGKQMNGVFCGYCGRSDPGQTQNSNTQSNSESSGQETAKRITFKRNPPPEPPRVTFKRRPPQEPQFVKFNRKTPPGTGVPVNTGHIPTQAVASPAVPRPNAPYSPSTARPGGGNTGGHKLNRAGGAMNQFAQLIGNLWPQKNTKPLKLAGAVAALGAIALIVYSMLPGGGGSGGGGGSSAYMWNAGEGNLMSPITYGDNIYFLSASNGMHTANMRKAGPLEKVDTGSMGAINPILLGDKMYYLSMSGLEIMDMKSGKTESIPVPGPNFLRYDGKDFYVVSRNRGFSESTLYRVDVKDKDYDEVYNLGSGDPVALMVMDGKVYYSHGNSEDDGGYRVVDLKSGVESDFAGGTTVAMLCSDGDTFFYHDTESGKVYSLKPGGKPAEIFDPAESMDTYDTYETQSIYLDGGYLYITARGQDKVDPSKSRRNEEACYRIKTNGSGLQRIILPDDSGLSEIVVYDGWISGSFTAYRIVADKVTESVEMTNSGITYEKLDDPIPLEDVK